MDRNSAALCIASWSATVCRCSLWFRAPAVAPAWLPTPLLALLCSSDTELYWFCCFNAPAKPSAAAAASPEAWRQEALGVVRGWAWGLPQVVEATPAEDLSRSRLVDR